jgi:hypothetical protein
MKFVRTFALAAAIALIGMCAGCGAKPQPLTPAQIASIACPQLDLVHNQFAVLNAALSADPATVAVGAKASAQLAIAHAVVTKVCNGAAAAPAVDASSIQALIHTGLPALGYLAGTLPLPPAQQAQVQAALVVAETAAGVAGVIDQQIKAAQVAPASAATVTPPLQ